jgi:hypothetical protein
MHKDLIAGFLQSEDTLRIYRKDRCVFSSNRGMLFPLLEYIEKCGSDIQKVLIMDKVAGNAAALLAIKAGAEQIYSPLGSELAAATLSRHKVGYLIERIVPYILAANGRDMCPMEKLSLDKDPEGLYRALKAKK